MNSLNKEYEVYEILNDLLPIVTEIVHSSLPPLGSEYETPSSDDWKALRELYDENYDRDLFRRNAVMEELRQDPLYCEPLLECFDAGLEQVCRNDHG